MNELSGEWLGCSPYLTPMFYRFISQNAEKLFNDNSAGSVSAADAVRLDTDQVEELAALLPPYEVFTRVHEDDR